MKLLTTAEAAAALGVSVRRVRAMITEGKLPAHRVGRDYAIEEDSLSSVKVYRKAGRPPKTEDTTAKDGKRRPNR
jgi:excisionase family DNA binding protein